MNHRPYIWMHEGDNDADAHVRDYRAGIGISLAERSSLVRRRVPLELEHSSVALRPMHLRSLERSREQGMFSLL